MEFVLTGISLLRDNSCENTHDTKKMCDHI